MHKQIANLFFFFLLATPYCIQASPTCSKWLATAISIQGEVDTQYSGNSNWHPIIMGHHFCYGDKVRTSKHSRIVLIFKDGPRITLDQNSTLSFSSTTEKTPSWIINLIKGSSFIRSRQSHRLNVQTPFINAVHEGTEFLVTVNDKQTEITVFDGQVAGTNLMGEIHIKKGYTGVAVKMQTPYVRPILIRPEDAVQWTLYYPPIIDVTAYTQAVFQPSLEAYKQGSLTLALNRLEKTAKLKQDIDYLSLKSSILLALGSVDEALKTINQALFIAPSNSSSYALQSIIAITKNRQDKALNLAKKAIKLDPKSTTAQIALSYAYQAKLKIYEALIATKEAVDLSPNNALAWARLAELQLSTGNHNAALNSAKKAQSLNPSLGRTQTVLGFNYLAQIDIDNAKSAFTQAIKLNSADPLAHLGLGLAKIRKGAVKEGSSDIETAASLDPDNAMMRSYLGKAYYELKNDEYAATELTISKQIDPNDPTPWFYDAIRKQTTNRPVEALHDMQKAIELNDNRGVYRSKLLLDEDLATKSANLSRIYSDLGFGRVALKQAWKALNYDSINSSAHRFLSDAYIGQPRYRIARASELLQAQLLQAINITPVQPQLTSENLGILNSTGPGSLSVNEYDPLYNSNGIHLVLNGSYGSNNTITDNAIISGIYDKFSMSLGQFHFQTDGYRKNDDYQHNIYDVFMQYMFTPNLNLQIELKNEHVKAGDLPLRQNNFHRQDLRKTIEHNTARIGGHYKINSKQDFIASFLYTKRKDNINDKFIYTDPDPFQETIDISSNSTENTGYQTEIQYLYHSNYFDVTAGFGYLNSENALSSKVANSFIIPPPDTLTDITQLQTQTHHFNGYIYSRFHLLPNLTTILGISFDALDNNIISFNSSNPFRPSPTLFERQQFNPKVGLIWTPIKNLSIRGASFRTLKRQLATSQTIEPTQIAGFNQFFDENNGTTAWNYALGLDYKPTKSIFIGGELSWRNTTHPLNINDTLDHRDQDESSHMAYIYWAPAKWLSFKTEYQFELTKRDFEQGKGSSILPQEVTTHHVPVSINLFHNNGLFAKVSGTYINQRVSSVRSDTGLDYQSEDFWTFDTSLGIRLPKKLGILSFEISNIFNNNFNYQSTFNASGPQISTYTPERQLFVKLNFNY